MLNQDVLNQIQMVTKYGELQDVEMVVGDVLFNELLGDVTVCEDAVRDAVVASDKEKVRYLVASQVLNYGILVIAWKGLVDHTDVEISEVSFFLSWYLLIYLVLFDTFIKTSFLLNHGLVVKDVEWFIFHCHVLV